MRSSQPPQHRIQVPHLCLAAGGIPSHRPGAEDLVHLLLFRRLLQRAHLETAQLVDPERRAILRHLLEPRGRTNEVTD